MVCVASERAGVCPNSCSGSNNGGEGDWLQGWEEAGNGTGRDKRKDPRQQAEGGLKG